MNAWTFCLWICRMFLHLFLWRIFSRAKFGSGTICDMFGFIHILLQHDLVWGDRGYWETIVAYMSVEDPDQACLMHLISAFGEICLLKKRKKWFGSTQSKWVLSSISNGGLVDSLCGLYMSACLNYVRNSGFFGFSYVRFSFFILGSPLILFKW